MSFPQRVIELTGLALKAGSKAAIASARQARKNFQYKPELDNIPSPRAGSSKSGTRITSQLAMSLEEAQLILNVKRDEPMDIIQRHYDQIFAANSLPPEPPQPPTPTAKRPPKPIHSHYLQSKVYRALERIKAERGEEGTGGGEPPPSATAAESAPVAGAAPGAGVT